MADDGMGERKDGCRRAFIPCGVTTLIVNTSVSQTLGVKDANNKLEVFR